MTYTKFTWTELTPITTFGMNHLEGQYDEITDDYNNHNHDSVYMPKTESDAKFWNDSYKTESDADTIDGYHAEDLLGAAIPPGGIVMYEGATPPAGYAICNGGNGTPDLRNYFVPCVKSTWSENSTFGNNSLTLSANITVNNTTLTSSHLPRHAHTYTDSYGSGSGAGGNYMYCCSSLGQDGSHTTTASTGGGGGHNHTGSISITNSSVDNTPLWYALYYIMKL